MTVSVKDIRVKISQDMIHSYVSQKGIDTIFKPYDIENNEWDVRFQCSDKSPEPNERRTNEDINRELERFKIISDRVRDSTLYVKTFDKHKVGFAFETAYDNRAIDSIDDVRKNAQNMIEKDVPQSKQQIRWYDS